MATRIVVQLTPGSVPDSAEWVRLADGVARVGGVQLRPSHPELPGVATFSVPDHLDVDAVLSSIAALPDVLHAERDSLASSQGDMGGGPAEIE